MNTKTAEETTPKNRCEHEMFLESYFRLKEPIKQTHSIYTDYGQLVNLLAMSASPLKKRIEELDAGYTERELEIAYCIGLLNRGLTMDELSEALKSAKEKLHNLKEAIKRGDFNVNNHGK